MSWCVIKKERDTSVFHFHLLILSRYHFWNDFTIHPRLLAMEIGSSTWRLTALIRKAAARPAIGFLQHLWDFYFSLDFSINPLSGRSLKAWFVYFPYILKFVSFYQVRDSFNSYFFSSCWYIVCFSGYTCFPDLIARFLSFNTTNACNKTIKKFFI